MLLWGNRGVAVSIHECLCFKAGEPEKPNSGEFSLIFLGILMGGKPELTRMNVATFTKNVILKIIVQK